MPQSVVVFNTITAALQAEKRLKREGLTVKLIPVPRHLSSDCGVCLRFERQDEPAVRRSIEEERIEIQGIYPV